MLFRIATGLSLGRRWETHDRVCCHTCHTRPWRLKVTLQPLTHCLVSQFLWRQAKERSACIWWCCRRGHCHTWSTRRYLSEGIRREFHKTFLCVHVLCKNHYYVISNLVTSVKGTQMNFTTISKWSGRTSQGWTYHLQNGLCNAPHCPNHSKTSPWYWLQRCYLTIFSSLPARSRSMRCYSKGQRWPNDTQLRMRMNKLLPSSTCTVLALDNETPKLWGLEAGLVSVALEWPQWKPALPTSVPLTTESHSELRYRLSYTYLVLKFWQHKIK